MGGLDSQRGATLGAMKIFAFMAAVSLGAWAICVNSVALVRHLRIKRLIIKFKAGVSRGNRCPDTTLLSPL